MGSRHNRTIRQSSTRARRERERENTRARKGLMKVACCAGTNRCHSAHGEAQECPGDKISPQQGIRVGAYRASITRGSIFRKLFRGVISRRPMDSEKRVTLLDKAIKPITSRSRDQPGANKSAKGEMSFFRPVLSGFLQYWNFFD